jgi:Protein of unknown function (DUF982)
MIWFPHPPVCVIDWARPGKVRGVSSVEAAAVELLRWPKTRKRDKAATLLADAMEGTADLDETKKAFEAAAKEARVWVAYRGP